MQQKAYRRCPAKAANIRNLLASRLIRQALGDDTPYRLDAQCSLSLLLFTLVIWVGLILPPSTALGQDFLFNSTLYTWEDGLPHRQINATIKDQQGLIWIATRAGVSQFDGYNFRNWTKIDDGLSSNEIGRIAQDKHGYIWAFSMPAYREDLLAIDLIDPLTGAVLDFTEVYSFSWPFDISQVRSFFHDTTSDRFYFGINQPSGILSFHPDEGFSFFSAPADISVYAIIGYDRQQNWWVQTAAEEVVAFNTDGVIRYRQAGVAKVIHYTHTYRPQLISWVGESPQGNALFVLSPEGEVTRTLIPELPWRESYYALLLLASLPDELSASTDMAAYLRTSSARIFQPFLAENETITQTLIKDVFIEEQGLAWLSTDAGLMRIKWSPSLFRSWEPRPVIEQDLIRTLAYVNDSLILVNAELSGTFLVNPYTLESQPLFPNTSEKLNMALALDGPYLACSRERDLYFGEMNGPLARVGVAQEKIWGIYPGFGDHYLITTAGGLQLFDPDQQQIIDYTGYHAFAELAKVQINFVGKDQAGNWWLCANTGFYQLHPTEGIQQRYWSKGEGPFFLPDDNIYHFYQDEAGIFWLSSGGGGLIRWDPSLRQTDQFTRSDGIAADFVYAAYEDEEQMLWLPTDYGLTLFDKKQQRGIRTFTPKDGLSHHEFNRTSYLQLPDGTLCFGAIRGLNIFHPDTIRNARNDQFPSMAVTAFSLFDSKTGTLADHYAEFMHQGQIIFEPDEPFARLEFALLNYSDIDRITYATRITPDETEWSYQEERSLRLGGLSYGVHELTIRGQAPNGQWSPHELKIPILVRRPIYLQPWFILIIAVFLTSVIISFFQWRTWNYRQNALRLKKAVDDQTATIRQQAEELQQLDQLKSRLFANVSHELRTPLTMILGPIGSMIKKDELTEEQRLLLLNAHRNGQDLLRLINNILDLSKMDAGKLQVQETAIALYPFLQQHIAKFESYADRLQLALSLDYRLDPQLILLTDQKKLATILRNYLSNALKHTPPGGRIEIILQEQEGQLLLEVSDTGDGIHPDDLPHIFDRFYQSKLSSRSTSGGTGIGLALCRELARALGGRVWAQSTLQVGSQFFLAIPKQEVIQPRGSATIQASAIPPTAREDVPLSSFTSASPGTSPRILVVEDNPNLQDYLQQLLAPTYQIQLAPNGLKALELLGRTSTGEPIPPPAPTDLPDLILSDVMMPRMDGLTFTHIVKQQSELAAIPIILLTAMAEQQGKLKALRIGVDDYLIKPFDDEELLVRIANALHRSQLRQGLTNNVQAGPEDRDLPRPAAPALSVADQEWLGELEQQARKLLESPHYNLDYLSSQLFISRRQLQRKIKTLTGLTPKAYIKEVRLQEARQLLEARRTDSVKATALAVGMKDIENFSKQFYQRFGKRPSDYLR